MPAKALSQGPVPSEGTHGGLWAGGCTGRGSRCCRGALSLGALGRQEEPHLGEVPSGKDHQQRRLPAASVPDDDGLDLSSLGLGARGLGGPRGWALPPRRLLHVGTVGLAAGTPLRAPPPCADPARPTPSLASAGFIALSIHRRQSPGRREARDDSRLLLAQQVTCGALSLPGPGCRCHPLPSPFLSSLLPPHPGLAAPRWCPCIPCSLAPA